MIPIVWGDCLKALRRECPRSKDSILLLLAYLISSVPFTIPVLCSDFSINSNPSPVGTVTHDSKTYLRLPNGQVGQSYSVTLSTTSHYADSMIWSIFESIPPGLGVYPSNMRGATLTLSGTPNSAGTFYFQIQARENYPNGASTRSQLYAITISPSSTPPPTPEPIRYTLDVEAGPADTIAYDLTPIVTGLMTHVYKGGYRIRLRKTGGSSELIRLEQVDLPEGVDMWAVGTLVRSPTELIAENLFLDGELTLDLGFDVGSGWGELVGPHGAERSHRIVIKARSSSGVEKSDDFYLLFSYTVPMLQVLGLEPVTQHGSTLIQTKQAIFKFNYTLTFTSSIQVTVRLKLDVREWHTYGLREYPSDDPNYKLIDDRITLEPTADGNPKTAYLFEDSVGVEGIQLPTPWRTSSSPDVGVSLEVDPSGAVTWDDRSTLSISRRFPMKATVPGQGEYVKLVFFQFNRFTPEQQLEAQTKLIVEPYLRGDPSPYETYLSGIFPARFSINDYVCWWEGGDIGWWDADTLAEEAAEEGYDRVVAIVPHGALGDAIGVVHNAGYWWWDQGFHTAFVDYDYAIDAPRYLYYPVVAHELSHTYRHGDIYGGDRQWVVDYDYVYFQEAIGDGINPPTGIIGIFKKDIYVGTDADPSKVLSGPDSQRLPLPTYVSAWDIMDYLRFTDVSLFWSDASYRKASESLTGTADPPEGLLVSMIVFRNGTVIGKPFQKLYNHTFFYPRTDAVGNFSLTLYDRGGGVFRSYPCNISFYYLAEPFGAVLSEAIPLITLVEWTDGLGRIELKESSNGRIWFERIVSEHAPTLEVIYPPEGKKLGIRRNYTIAWSGIDEDGDQLWYTVLLKGSGDPVWRLIASRIREDRVTFTPSDNVTDPIFYEEGDYELQIKVTDGVNTAVKVLHVHIVEQSQIKIYDLFVGSNIGLKIDGSGTYEEGDLVRIEAPAEEPMKDLLGLLGGKYQFDRWTGAVESKDEEVVVPMTGEQTSLTATAIYVPNYTQVYLVLGTLVILAVAIMAVLKLGRKPKPTLPLPPPPPP